MIVNAQTMRVFKYSDDETQVFPYLKTYANSIAADPPKGDDADAVERYMLAGLFLTFRACNHSGVVMSTEVVHKSLPDRHRRRLKMYKEVTGKTIGDQHQYLRRLHYNRLLFALFGPGRMLYRYVRYGRAWWKRLLPHLPHKPQLSPEWLAPRV